VHKDVPSLIRYPSRQPSYNVSHHESTYRLAAFLTVPLLFSLLLFWTITRGSSRAVVDWEILPQSYLFVMVLCFALPYIRLSRSGRYRFLSILKRVSIGGLAEAQDGRFGDIILADVLTSYAKVLGDLFVCICMLLSKGTSSTAMPNRGCGGAFTVPLIISVPSIIRLRQCLIEFTRVRKQHQASSGWGGQHVGNALKYSTAFPVIILSALQRGYDPAKIHMSEAGLFRLWYEYPSVLPMHSDRSQVVLRISEFFLFVLLGRLQRLGSQPFLAFLETERPRPSVWTSAASTLQFEQLVLRSDHH
jgi:EXS family